MNKDRQILLPTSCCCSLFELSFVTLRPLVKRTNANTTETSTKKMTLANSHTQWRRRGKNSRKNSCRLCDKWRRVTCFGGLNCAPKKCAMDGPVDLELYLQPEQSTCLLGVVKSHLSYLHHDCIDLTGGGESLSRRWNVWGTSVHRSGLSLKRLSPPRSLEIWTQWLLGLPGNATIPLNPRSTLFCDDKINAFDPIIINWFIHNTSTVRHRILPKRI